MGTERKASQQSKARNKIKHIKRYLIFSDWGSGSLNLEIVGLWPPIIFLWLPDNGSFGDH